MRVISAPLKSIGLSAMPAAKNFAWLIGGVAISAVFTVSAQQYMASSQSQAQEDCYLTKAAQDAMNKKIRMIALTSSDPDKYFNQNCLGDLSFASLDLSKMVPDPLGWMTDAALAALEALKKAAIGKVCAAARNALGDTLGQYNMAMGMVNGSNDAAKMYIDQTLGQQGREVQDKMNLGYNSYSPPVSTIGENMKQNAWKNQNGVPVNPVTLLNNNAASASDYTVAAGNLEQARANLASSRQAAEARAAAAAAQTGRPVSAASDPQLMQAQAAFDRAQQAYSAAQTQTTTPTVTQSTSTPSVGGSIFGR